MRLMLHDGIVDVEQEANDPQSMTVTRWANAPSMGR
jgi:hypothetical protein